VLRLPTIPAYHGQGLVSPRTTSPRIMPFIASAMRSACMEQMQFLPGSAGRELPSRYVLCDILGLSAFELLLVLPGTQIYSCPTAVTLQEMWEAQAAVVERNMKAAAAEVGAAEDAADGGNPAQQHGLYEAQLQRLLAADVVLVPYGVLSQEV
jgi:hypothetical protein